MGPDLESWCPDESASSGRKDVIAFSFVSLFPFPRLCFSLSPPPSVCVCVCVCACCIYVSVPLHLASLLVFSSCPQLESTRVAQPADTGRVHQKIDKYCKHRQILTDGLGAGSRKVFLVHFPVHMKCYDADAFATVRYRSLSLSYMNVSRSRQIFRDRSSRSMYIKRYPTQYFCVVLVTSSHNKLNHLLKHFHCHLWSVHILSTESSRIKVVPSTHGPPAQVPLLSMPPTMMARRCHDAWASN